MKDNILERFLRYVKIDTESDSKSKNYPSTSTQLDFGRELVKELKDIGVQNASIDSYGYVTASIPANTEADIPTIAFIAHMDTSPDLSGKNVNPQVLHNYDGSVIQLNKEDNIALDPEEYPEILNYIDQTIITTDGKTLLGADDKAGIAEIMTAMEYIINTPEIKHGVIKIAFTPDEEIGKGVDHFNVKKFGADFGYTLDGGSIGELEYENFNAAVAIVRIKGRNIHPGNAKNRMLNSLTLAMEFEQLLPENEKPEYTSNYEGFYHLTEISGSVDSAEVTYIIRDHDYDKFNDKKILVKNCIVFLNKKYSQDTFALEMHDQYYNMKEKIVPVYHIIDTAREALEELDIHPLIIPIRGGTDGARLSYMGLPCPNLFTGGHNYHGRYEYIPLESMEKAALVIIKIIEKYADK